MEPQSQSSTTAKGNVAKRIILPAMRTFIAGVIALGAVLCLLAGTINYWQGWVFIILFMGLTSQQGVYLSMKDPELLERRKQIAPAAESTKQKIFIFAGFLSVFGAMAVSALDRRFGWSQMSPVVSLVGFLLIVLGYYVYYLVFRENSFAAASVKTFEGQQVISTGPYALVRHPKYSGDLLLVLGIPLALGSWWGLAWVVLTLPGLAWRLLDEETLLKHDLPGYAEYAHKVRHRLLPYLW